MNVSTEDVSDVKIEESTLDCSAITTTNDAAAKTTKKVEKNGDDDAIKVDLKPDVDSSAPTALSDSQAAAVRNDNRNGPLDNANVDRTATVAEDNQREKKNLPEADDEEPVVFCVRKSPAVSAPRKTYGSKRRSQNIGSSGAAAEPHSFIIYTSGTTEAKSESDAFSGSSADNDDDDFLPSSSKRIRVSDSPPSMPSSASLGVVDEPAPFLGPDVAVVVGENSDSAAEEKPKVDLIDAASATTIPHGAIAADESSLITFDLESLLTTDSGLSAVGDGGPKVLTIGNGGRVSVRLVSPPPPTTITNGGDDVRSLVNGSTRMIVDLPDPTTTTTLDDNCLLEDDVNDPNAIYIQSLLNGAAAAASSTPDEMIDTKMKNEEPVCDEILLDSDDEPEIVFVEEKRASTALKTKPRAPRPMGKKIGPSIIDKITSLTAQTSSPKSATTTNVGKRRGGSSASSSRPEYFSDAGHYTVPDKFSYMKIKRSKRKGKPIIDDQVSIPSDVFQMQLKDTTDIVARISLAPFSKRTMHMLEYGGIERAFCLPSKFIRDSPKPLLELHSKNMKTRMAMDETETEVRQILGMGVRQMVGVDADSKDTTPLKTE